MRPRTRTDSADETELGEGSGAVGMLPILMFCFGRRYVRGKNVFGRVDL